MTAKRRGHNEGSIWQTPDGRWRGAVTIHLPDGTTKRRYVRGKTKREVQQKVAVARDAARDGVVEPAHPWTVREWLWHWLDVIKRGDLDEATYALYRREVRRIEGGLGGVRLAALTITRIERWERDLRETATAGVVLRAHRILARALREAASPHRRLIPFNPADGITLPPAPTPKRAALSGADVDALLSVAAGSDDPLVALWAIAATSGLRRGEVVGLHWGDVDLVRRRLSIRGQLVYRPRAPLLYKDTKTDRVRVVPLGPTAAELLAAHQAREEDERGPLALADYVFRRPDGRPLNPVRVSQLSVRAIARAALPHIPLHGLRHTMASVMLDEGVPLKVVSDILGHASMKTTADIYTHVFPAMADAAAEAMDRAVRRGTGPRPDRFAPVLLPESAPRPPEASETEPERQVQTDAEGAG